jgi:hypothetical protein
MKEYQAIKGKEVSPRWKGAFEELQIKTDQHHRMQDCGELTPDSMSSRLSASSVADRPNHQMDELFVNNMNSRCNGFVGLSDV